MFSVAEQPRRKERMRGLPSKCPDFFCPPPVFVKRKVEYLPFRTLEKGGMTRGKGNPPQAETKSLGRHATHCDSDL